MSEETQKEIFQISILNYYIQYQAYQLTKALYQTIDLRGFSQINFDTVCYKGSQNNCIHIFKLAYTAIYIKQKDECHMKTAIKKSTIMCCYSWLLKNTAMHVEGLVTARNVTQWLKSCHPVWQKIDKSVFQMQYPILILIMTGSGFEIEFRLPNENINFHSLYAVK